jgi:hypothetical protein
MGRAASHPSSDTRAPYPLGVVYAQAGILAPLTKEIASGRIPQPYRSLLSHEQPMTLTLESHFGGALALRTLSTLREGRSYFRRALLVKEDSGRPVEMGAIHLNLDAFRPGVRRQILANTIPLGRLLREGGVDYRSRPRVFLKVTPNAEMMGLFRMPKALPLYGRQTVMSVDGRKVGDIVEILPLV